MGIGHSARNLVIIGSSTGGPSALKSLFTLTPPLDAAVIIVQHMPEYINELLAADLQVSARMPCRVVRGGDIFEKGRLYLAPSGRHLLLGSLGNAYFSQGEQVNYVRPSVDVFMESVRRSTFNKIAGVILTGMGIDGAKGLGHLKEIGALTIAQNQESSAIFGMPKAAIELGAADEVLPLDRIGARLSDYIGSGSPS